MSPLLRVLSGLALIGLGIGLLPRPEGRLHLPPSSQDLLRLSGPLRVLPVPFAWQAFGRASRQQDEALILSRGRWLLSLMPEAESLYAGLAWRLAYHMASAEDLPIDRARRIREALVLLEEGMRERPELPDLPALAGYVLQNRAEAPGMEAALTQVLGESPYLRASRYLDRAASMSQLDGGKQFLLMTLSVRLVELGERAFAAQVLETLSSQKGNPAMSRSMRALAVALRAKGPLRLSRDLCQWVLETEPFSRKPGLWPCRQDGR